VLFSKIVVANADLQISSGYAMCEAMRYLMLCDDEVADKSVLFDKKVDLAPRLKKRKERWTKSMGDVELKTSEITERNKSLENHAVCGKHGKNNLISESFSSANTPKNATQAED